MRRRSAIKALTLSVGQQHIIVGIGDYGWSSSTHYIVVSDGVRWTAVKQTIPPTPPNTRFQNWSSKTMRMMPAELRLPLLWATKALKGKPDGTAIATDAAAVDTSQVFPFGDAPTDRVTFIGYRRRKLAHSMETLVNLFTECVQACQFKWGWRPVVPEVEIHTTSRAMGLAFINPTVKRHRISLHLKLLTQYDLASIRRVVLHELCHHYREEAFPPNRYEAHDHIFCQELQKVDVTLAADAEKAQQPVAKMCTMFYEQRDAEIIAISDRKKHRDFSEAVWSPEAGYVELARLKSGRFRFAWRPNPGFKWTVKAEALADLTLRDLVKRFAPTQLDTVAVRIGTDKKTGATLWPTGRPAPANLLGFVDWATRSFPRHLPSVISYMRDVILVHTKASA